MKQSKVDFRNLKLTHSAAHHLVAIAQLLEDYGYARVTDVARELGLTRGSVSITLRSMQARGFIDRDSNGFYLLTPIGSQLARATLAKNARINMFLVEVLGVDEAVAELDSCNIDHLLSGESVHQLCNFVQFLSSGLPASRAFLEAFREYKVRGNGDNECDLCEEECLFKG